MLSELQILSLLPAHLANVFDVAADRVRVLPAHPRLDLAVEIEGQRFDIECKGRADTATTLAGIRALRQSEPLGHPLLVVPYMGAKGASLCRDECISWTDLSGNADIRLPGLKIILKGSPNKYPATGRPSNAFAPKSARVTRELLHRAPSPVTQAELAALSGLGSGFVSRIVRRLADDGLLVRGAGATVSVIEPDVLLDAWAERYRFGRQRMVKGHISAGSSPELMERLHELLEAHSISHAFTGLASAWLRQEHARFRLVTVYAQPMPSAELLDELRFREGPRGANVWFVEPADSSLFNHLEVVRGLPCTSSLQTYLDLLDLPERAEEAAGQLRSEYLRWGEP